MKKQILTQQQIEEKLFKAEDGFKPADFTGENLPSFSLVKETINSSIIFDNAQIQGQVFMADVFIDGDLSFKDCLIKGSLYLANLHLNGNLILENARIEGAVNLVGAEIEKNVLAK
ncbi:MAG: hypothetical protein PHO19_02835, partial [Candidatus Pacebacteria bacterium]|nr:hypothetical protein [Candidatus Paceibacterota bacterium]